MYIKHQLFKQNFKKLETFEGEYLSLLDPFTRYFKQVRSTDDNNQSVIYDYFEKFSSNPLPEHQLEYFIYYSFLSNKSEIKIMTDFFGSVGRSDSKNYMEKKSFYSTKQYKNFMSRNGFMLKFLFKLPHLLKVFADSGEGRFLGTLVNWIFDRYKDSVLKSESTSRSYYFEADKKIEIPKNIIETLKSFKNLNEKKVKASGFGEMNERVIGNYTITTKTHKTRVIENAKFFNHLEAIVFNLQANNLKINLNYGLISYAIEELSKDSFNK
jgi:hypothetical protein